MPILLYFTRFQERPWILAPENLCLLSPWCQSYHCSRHSLAFDPTRSHQAIIVVGWLFLIASVVMWAQLKANSSRWAIPVSIVNLIAMATIYLTYQINSIANATDEEQGVVEAGVEGSSLASRKSSSTPSLGKRV